MAISFIQFRHYILSFFSINSLYLRFKKRWHMDYANRVFMLQRIVCVVLFIHYLIFITFILQLDVIISKDTIKKFYLSFKKGAA